MLKIKNISNIHEFYYEELNYNAGVSENNFQKEININR